MRLSRLHGVTKYPPLFLRPPSPKKPPQHTEVEVRETLQPIAKIQEEAGDIESAAMVLREWVGVSASPAAAAAFVELLKRSPAGLACALDFSPDTKRHWFRENKLDRDTFDRVVALATEEHRRAAVVRVSLEDHKIGGRLPAELGRLTNLQELVLEGNALTGRSRLRACSTQRDGSESGISHTFPVPAMCRRDSRVDREPDEAADAPARGEQALGCVIRFQNA